MKTSEFIKKLDEHREKVINVKQEYNLYDELETTIITEQFTITYRNNKEPNEIIDIIAEYLMTSVKGRKDKKKYYLRHKGINEYDNFLNLEYETQSYYVSSNEEFYDYKTQFTQSEIDEMPEYYKHPAVWEQIEVEREEE